MSGASHELPPIPPGYKRITGQQNPPDASKRYWVAFRCGAMDLTAPYPVEGTRWIWGDEPDDFDIIAVKDA